jgi:MATE family multidrug resistance protein
MHNQSWLSQLRKILSLGIPLIIANVAMIGMEVIDTIMAGQASAEDLAGLAIGGNIWLIIEVAMGGLLSALTPRLSRFHGAGKFSEITTDTQQGLLLGLFVGILAMFLMLSVIPLLPLLGTSDSVTLIAQGYTEIIAYSLPASGICWVLFCLFESHSLMRFVVLSSLGALILNLIFDYIFVFGKFGFPALGGVGCAWTTTTIYWLWAFSFIFYTINHEQLKGYKIFDHWPKFNWQRWKAILALGLPISFSLLAEEGFFNISALLVAPLGTEPLGAHQITIQVVSLVLMFGLGIGQATAICVAHSIGKAETSSIIDHLKAGFFMVASVAFLVGVLVFIFRNELPSLFTQNIAIAAISTSIMVLAPLYLLIDAIQIWAGQTLRGFEDTKIPMVIQIISYWVIGFPLGYSLGVTSFWGEPLGVYGFWIGFLGGVTFGSCLLGVRLYLKSQQFKDVQPSLS